VSTPRGAQRDIADEIGRGPLARGAAFVYRMLVLEGQLLLAILPTGITVLLLGRDPSNLPLFVLALLPIAPALVAGVAATRTWLQGGTSSAPIDATWRRRCAGRSLPR